MLRSWLKQFAARLFRTHPVRRKRQRLPRQVTALESRLLLTAYPGDQLYGTAILTNSGLEDRIYTNNAGVIGISLNLGDGQYGPIEHLRQEADEGSWKARDTNFHRVTATDFNHDSIPDLEVNFTARFTNLAVNDSETDYFIGNGDGTFTFDHHVGVHSGEYSSGIVVEDVIENHGPTTGGDFISTVGVSTPPKATLKIGELPPAAARHIGPWLSFRVPAGIGANLPLVLTVEAETYRLSQTFSYDPPEINGLYSNTAPTGGGTPLTITGHNFSPNLAQNVVMIGNRVAAIQSANADGTELVVKTPAGDGINLPVVVTVGNQSSQLSLTFSYSPPSIQSVSTNHGPTTGNTLLTISGSSFGSSPTVTIGGFSCPVQSIDSTQTQLVISTPAGVGADLDVIVTDSATQRFAVAPAAFSYDATLANSLVPTHGPTGGGTLLTITGNGFSPDLSLDSVKIGEVLGSIQSVSDDGTQMVVMSPAGNGTNLNVVVTVAGQKRIASLKFSYDPPQIDSISPNHGPAGVKSLITISGSSFGTSPKVSIGGVTAPLQSNNATNTQLVVAVPAGAGKELDVVVTDSITKRSHTLTKGFSYDAPLITSLSSTSAPTGGGTLVTISGFSFSPYIGQNSVMVGSFVAPIQSVSPDGTQLVIQTPTGDGTNLPVAVTVVGQPSNQLSFSYSPPTVKVIAPNFGSTTTSSLVTIFGSSFGSSPSVTIGGVNCLVQSVNPTQTQLVVTVPAGTGSNLDVIVTDSATQQSVVVSKAFTFYATGLLGMTPTTGSTSGGTLLTITGSGFSTTLSQDTVTIGGLNAPVQSVTPDGTTLIVKTPAGDGTNLAVSVTVSGQTSNSLFFSYAPPSVVSISPNRGTTAGRSLLTILGSSFGSNPTVTIGGVICPVQSINSTHTQLVVLSPAGVGSNLDVVVTNASTSRPGILSRGFSYDAPVVTSLSAATGPSGGGTLITITGNGFSPNINLDSVTIGDLSAPVQSASSDGTQLVIKTPAGEGTNLSVVVTVGGQTSNPSLFNYAPPAIQSFSPASGPASGNTLLTIFGSSFGPSPSVTIGGLDARVVSNNTTNTQLVVRVPAGVGPKLDVVVTDLITGRLSLLSQAFSYTPPAISSLSPDSGPTAGGNLITIQGSSFATDLTLNSVTIGGVPARLQSVNANGTQLVVQTPAGDGTNLSVLVTVGGQVSNPILFSYAPPTVLSVSPNHGPLVGNILVTVFGSSFGTNPTVTIGGINAPLQADGTTSTQLVVMAPAGVGKDLNVVVTDSITSQTGILPKGFSYDAPTISRLSSNTAPTGGGSLITITGSSFSPNLGLNSVKIGLLSAPVFGVSPDGTQLIVKVPAGDGKNLPVVVTVANQPSNTLSFSYAPPTVQAITPDHGPTVGNTLITIIGSSFGTSPTVTIGGIDAPVQSNNSTNSLLVVSVPAGSGTGLSVVVTDSVTGQFGVLPGGFSYDPPAITSLSSTSGPTGGGTVITITGNNFSPVLGLDSVTIGDRPALIQSVSPDGTQLVIQTPAGDGINLPVVVMVARQSSNPLTFSYDPPSVVSVAPNHSPAAGNTLITIFGSSFGPNPTVTIGEISVPVQSDNPTNTQLVVSVPAGVGKNLNVAVTDPITGRTDLLPNGFSYAPPAITDLSSTSGPTGGGTLITITGTSFSTNPVLNSVKIGGVPATVQSVNEDGTQLVIKTPASDGIDLLVVVTVGNQASNSLLFSYAAPSLIAISPNHGPAAGNTLITIFGSSFGATPTVTIGGINALVQSNNPANTQLVVVAPSGVGAGLDVVVTDSLTGQKGLISKGFSYDAPVILGISPGDGPSSGGNLVTISGSSFSPSLAFDSVKIGGLNAPIRSVNSDGTQLVVAAPAGHGIATVVVTVGDQSSAGGAIATYTYDKPKIASITPGNAPAAGGTRLTIVGTNFGTGPKVTIGGIDATVFSVSSTKVVVTAPAGVGSNVPVILTTNEIPSSAFSFKYDAPKITSLSVNNGLQTGGTVVTITGTSFSPILDLDVVTIGGVPATLVSVNSTGTKLVIQTPAGVGAAPVVVTAGNQSSLNDPAIVFNYALPQITSITPATTLAAGGGRLTINGTNFGTSPTVTIGGVNANVMSFTNTKVIVTAPPGVGTDVPVILVTSGLSSNTFSINYAPPTISSLSVNNGLLTGGTTITITGTSFSPNLDLDSVTIGGVPANLVSVNTTGTKLVLQTPAGVGSAPVVVTVGGQSSVNDPAIVFNYVLPVIISVTPNNISAAGGGRVTLIGTNFGTNPTVTIGGLDAKVLSFSNTKAIVTAPAGVGTDLPVVLVTSGLSSNTSSFSYAPPTITSLSVNNGLLTGGTVVTITGTSFSPDLSRDSVTIGGSPATLISVNATGTRLIIQTPAGVGSSPVVVTVGGQSSVNDPSIVFNYVLPVITSITPGNTTAAGGGRVTLMGTNFGTNPTVTIGGLDAKVLSFSNTRVIVAAPAGVGTDIPVVLTTSGLTSNTFTMNYAPPTIGSLSVDNGLLTGGTLVTITGTSFAPNLDLNSVTIGGVPATLVSVNTTGTRLVIRTPAGVGSAPVVVTVGGQSSFNDPAVVFNYVMPSITSITPGTGSAAGGTRLTIVGTNFGNSPTVTIGGVDAKVLSISNTKVVVVAPPGIGTNLPAVLTTTGLTSNTFSFSYDPPSITALSIGNGPASGGTLVTITGASFSPNLTLDNVTIGGITATVVSVNSTGTKLVIRTPAGFGTVPIVITVGGQMSEPSLIAVFTYD